MSGVGMYESIAAGLGTNGCMRPGGLVLTELALSRCAFPPQARVLDIGCGIGGTVAYLREQHHLSAFGIDPSMSILRHGLAGNAARSLVAAEGAALPFGEDSWDGVFAECSLSLAKDALMVLDECLRVLRRGGWLILSDVYLRVREAKEHIRGLPSSCCLARAMTRDEWLENLATRGFRDLHWEDHSPALKVFAAQLILSHGSSIEEFWCRAAADRGETAVLGEVRKTVALARPGYFMLTARRSALRWMA